MKIAALIILTVIAFLFFLADDDYDNFEGV